MPSNRAKPLALYPATWLQAVRDAFDQPGQRIELLARAAEPASAVETQQRKLRAFLSAYPKWPRVDPAVNARLAAGWVLKTHRKLVGPPQDRIAVFYLSAHPPRGHEIELVKKALAGG